MVSTPAPPSTSTSYSVSRYSVSRSGFTGEIMPEQSRRRSGAVPPAWFEIVIVGAQTGAVTLPSPALPASTVGCSLTFDVATPIEAVLQIAVARPAWHGVRDRLTIVNNDVALPTEEL